MDITYKILHRAYTSGCYGASDADLIELNSKDFEQVQELLTDVMATTVINIKQRDGYVQSNLLDVLAKHNKIVFHGAIIAPNDNVEIEHVRVFNKRVFKTIYEPLSTFDF